MYKAFQTIERVKFVKPERSAQKFDRLLRVGMFSSEYPPCWGGVGKHVQNLCRRLQSHVNLRLVTATYGRPVERFALTNLARLRVRSFPLLLAQYLTGVRLEQIKENELIHAHVPNAFMPRGRKRIVSTFHLVWADYSKALQHRRPISLFDLQIPTWNHRLMENEKKLAAISDAVIAVSHSVKMQLVERYGLPARKIHVIHNGVAADQYHPSRKHQNIILYVGRQTAHKGLPYLLEAFARFSKSHREYTLVLVGERLEGGVDPSLIQLSKRLGIRRGVKFTGRLPESQAKKILARARCLVLPSLAEAFGMTVLEGMASGTPVIATNVGGIPEVLRNGRNGLLVPPADAIALANSMERIASDPKLRRRLMDGGIRTSRQFTWDETAQKTLDVYRQVYS